MKKNILILSMVTGMLLTSCGDNTTTQTVPETPEVVEPQTMVEDLQVPYQGEEPEIFVESSEDLVTDEAEETEETEETDETIEEGADEETSSTATELSTSVETNGSETTTTTTTTTVETTPSTGSTSSTSSSTSSTSTSTSSTTSSTSTSSTTSSASTSSTTSSASTSSTTASASTSSTTSSTSASTTSTTQNINSYVDFYVVDMDGKPLSGVTTKFGSIAPSATTDSTGKTRTQLTSSNLGLNFADTLSLTYGHAFKANVTLLDSANSNKNISHVETSEYSVLTQLNTATINSGSSITVSDNQVISVIVMIDFNTASTTTSTNTSTSTSTSTGTSSSDGAEINSSIYVSLDDRTYAYDYDYYGYSRDYNQVKVEVELISPDRKETKMVTIYDSDNGYGGTHKFRESEAEWLLGSLIVITSYHQFEVEMEFDDILWRDDRGRAQSTNLGNGQYAVYLHDIVDETVNYGKDFTLYLIMDNKGTGTD